jgi:hypothetical protein
VTSAERVPACRRYRAGPTWLLDRNNPLATLRQFRIAAPELSYLAMLGSPFMFVAAQQSRCLRQWGQTERASAVSKKAAVFVKMNMCSGTTARRTATNAISASTYVRARASAVAVSLAA